MKFCVIIINDGRNDYLEKALKSFSENVIFPEGSTVYKILIDDWPQERDIDKIEELAEEFWINDVVLNEKNLGVNETVRKVWGLIPDTYDYVFHQENDFIYLEKIHITDLMNALESPIIVQCALKRQAWFEDEREAGDLFNTRPERFRSANMNGSDLVLQKDHFTFNPSLYKRKWVNTEIFPFGEYQISGHYLQKNPALWFAYLGKRTDTNKILHIGEKKR